MKKVVRLKKIAELKRFAILLRKKGLNLRNVIENYRYSRALIRYLRKGKSKVKKYVYIRSRRKIIRINRRGVENRLVEKLYEGDMKDKGRSVMSFLCGMMMRSGNRRQIECKINKVMKSIRKEIGCNFEKIMNKLRKRLEIPVGLFKRRVSGTTRSIPMLIPKYKSVRVSWKRLVRGIRGRHERGIEQKMIGEIIDMNKGGGNSMRVLEEDKEEIRKGKVWIKYLRR